MRVLILGIDGYLGWPLALHLKARGHELMGVDDGSRRRRVKECGGNSAFELPSMETRAKILGCTIHEDSLPSTHLDTVVEEFKPETIVYLAEQPSAPYSMIGVEKCLETIHGNVMGTAACLWAIKNHVPECHLLKLGTMGSWGTPNVDIPEGWFDLEFRGRTTRAMFPKCGGSMYHNTKICDSTFVEFACRNWGLRSTDVMQGVVYGTRTPEMGDPINQELRTRFDSDACFPAGTMVMGVDGEVPIEEVSIGDRVLTHEGRYRSVTRVFERSAPTLIRLGTAGQEISATPNHPFLVVEKVRNAFEEPKWMSVEEIHGWIHENDEYNGIIDDKYDEAMALRRDKGLSPNRIANEIGIKSTTVEGWVYHGSSPRKSTRQRDGLYLVHFRPKDEEDVACIDCTAWNKWEPSKYNPDRQVRRPLPPSLDVDEGLMFFCGLWLAQGWVSNGYQTGLALCGSRHDNARDFCKGFLSSLGLHVGVDGDGKIWCSSAALCRLLADTFGSGSRGKHIPRWVKRLPEHKLRSLLEGIYYDGWQGNALELVNRGLCESVREIHARLGEFASITSRTVSNVSLPDGRFYDGESVFHRCYWHGGKKDIKYHDGMILVPVKSTSIVDGECDVFNLEVEEDHTYIANSFTVHNCFGTAINRYCAQAVLGLPITPYGAGGQTRGFLPLKDSIQCMRLAIESPPEPGQYRVVNQLEECFSVLELAGIVARCAAEVGMSEVEVQHVDNPRKEAENHYYHPDHNILLELGYEPTGDINATIREMLVDLMGVSGRLAKTAGAMEPRVRW